MRIVFLTNTYSPTAVAYIKKLANANRKISAVYLINQKSKYKKDVLNILKILKKYGLAIIIKRIFNSIYLSLRLFFLKKGWKASGDKGYFSVEELLLDYPLSFCLADDVNGVEVRNKLKEIGPDIIFVCTLNQILKKEIIAIPKYGCINIHAGLLPKYRGPASNFWVLYNKEEETGVTFHYIDQGIDTGDILAQRRLKISPEDTEESLDKRLSQAGSEIILDVLEAIENNTMQPRPQKKTEGCYFSQPSKDQRQELIRKRN